jgi:hypothetical protein
MSCVSSFQKLEPMTKGSSPFCLFQKLPKGSSPRAPSPGFDPPLVVVCSLSFCVGGEGKSAAFGVRAANAMPFIRLEIASEVGQ